MQSLVVTDIGLWSVATCTQWLDAVRVGEIREMGLSGAQRSERKGRLTHDGGDSHAVTSY